MGNMTTDRQPTHTAPAGTGSFTLGPDTALHLAPDQTMTALALDEGAWRQLDRVPWFGHGRVLSIFDYRSTWTWWERHPNGEELVLVLSGSVVFHLDDGERRTVPLRAREGTLVPRGTWHRAEITRPTRMLFVTASPAETEHRDA
jgi:mannose-6-phosphate isomerase-like protein (cupin superfamily)